MVSKKEFHGKSESMIIMAKSSGNARTLGQVYYIFARIPVVKSSRGKIWLFKCSRTKAL